MAQPARAGGEATSDAPWRGVSWALLALALAELLRQSWAVPAQTDDAYISYRYARNLVEGVGLVFNPGEYVEGITNLLWTLMVAVGLALGFSAKVVGHALGVSAAALTLGITFAYARSGLAAERAWVAGAAPCLLVSFLSFGYWTTSGMETPLFAALVTATLLAQARGRAGWTVACALLATATRPDGALVAAVVLAFQLAADREQRWRALRWPLLYALGIAALTAFRLAYYGSPVPNTFYAKVGGVPLLRGAYYVMGFFSAGAWLLCLPAGVALVREARWWPAGVLVLVSAVYVVSVGGDAFPYWRFLLPLLPALVVLAVRGADLLWQQHRAAGAAAWLCVAGALVWNAIGFHVLGAGGCALLLACGWAGVASLGHSRLAPVASVLAVAIAFALAMDLGPHAQSPFHPALAQRARADALARSHEYNERFERLAERRSRSVLARDGADTLVATGGIGAFGYYSGVPIVDLFGLVDPEIARSRSGSELGLAAPGHQRSNADYVFAREPVYLLVPQRGTSMVTAPAVRDLWAHPDLDAHYEWDAGVVGYRRKRGS